MNWWKDDTPVPFVSIGQLVFSFERTSRHQTEIQIDRFKRFSGAYLVLVSEHPSAAVQMTAPHAAEGARRSDFRVRPWHSCPKRQWIRHLGHRNTMMTAVRGFLDREDGHQG